MAVPPADDYWLFYRDVGSVVFPRPVFVDPAWATPPRPRLVCSPSLRRCIWPPPGIPAATKQSWRSCATVRVVGESPSLCNQSFRGILPAGQALHGELELLLDAGDSRPNRAYRRAWQQHRRSVGSAGPSSTQAVAAFRALVGGYYSAAASLLDRDCGYGPGWPRMFISFALWIRASLSYPSVVSMSRIVSTPSLFCGLVASHARHVLN